MTAVREIIKPQSQTYALHIPREYINKEVEVIILPTFTADKSVHMPDADQFDPSLYFGAAEALKSDIDSYLMDIRGEW